MNPMILLHGALGASGQLQPLKKLLEEKGRAVYTLDFSGHGGRPLADAFGIETFATDVLDAMNRQAIAQADIFGYSMGGYVALWLAHREPSRLGTIITLGTKFDWSPAAAEREVQKMNAEKIEAKIPAFARILQHRHAPVNWKDLLSKTANMMKALGSEPLIMQAVAQSITHRTHVLLGDGDDMADRNYSEQVARWLPHGGFTLLPNTTHPIEKIDLTLLLPFLLERADKT